MGFIRNLKVVHKQIVLIGVFLIALISVGSVGYYFLNKTNMAMEKMYSEKLLAVELLGDSRTHARKIEANTYALMLTTDEGENKALFEDISNRGKAFDENLSKYEQLALSDKDKENVRKIREDLGKYRNVRSQVLDLAVKNKNAEAYALYIKDGKPLSDQFTAELRSLADETAKGAEEVQLKNRQDFAFANLLFTGIIITAILLGLFIGWIITRQIITRLQDVVNYLEIVAKGDFSRDIKKENLADQSEFGNVSRAVHTMRENIKELIRQMSTSSEQVAASSEELTANAEQSAQASNQVAVSVTEVAEGAAKQSHLADQAAGIVNHIAEAIHHVAGSMENVSAAAEKTAVTADDGEAAIKKSVTQMKIIEEKTAATSTVISMLEDKSKQIGQIVDTIAAIASQTNLLALNAAIEAARAGEAGRGFSVVAEEVRKLAEQSQDAAKQITELIQEVQLQTGNAVSFMQVSQKEVHTGGQVVNTAGQSFETILGMVQNMTREIHEVSAAVQEITSGTQNVVDAVRNIDTQSKRASEQTQNISAATEEQSASVEEIASASEHLAKLAEELQQAVQKFKI